MQHGTEPRKTGGWLNMLMLSVLITATLSFFIAMAVLLASEPATIERLEPWICADDTQLEGSSSAFTDRLHGQGESADYACCDEKRHCKAVTGMAMLFLFLAAAVPVGLGITPLVGIASVLNRRFGYRPVLWGLIGLSVIVIIVVAFLWW